MIAQQDLREPKYWLLGIGTCLVALHLTYLNQIDDSELFATCVLFWMVIGSLIWDRRNQLELESDLFSSCFGAALIAVVLFHSLAAGSYHLRLGPFLSGLGLCLMASGFKRLRHYWKELLILGLLLISPIVSIVLELLDLSLITAKFSAFMLWYGGLDVVRQGVFIVLPKGSVQVYGLCSGVHAISQMLNISVLFLLMVKTSWVQKIITIVVAVALGFVVNAGRVGLMAILVAASQPEAFQFWHDGTGSMIFSAIAVLFFGVFCWLAFLRTPSEPTEA